MIGVKGVILVLFKDKSTSCCILNLDYILDAVSVIWLLYGCFVLVSNGCKEDELKMRREFVLKITIMSFY